MIWEQCCVSVVKKLKGLPIGVVPMQHWQTIQEWFVDFRENKRQCIKVLLVHDTIFSGNYEDVYSDSDEEDMICGQSEMKCNEQNTEQTMSLCDRCSRAAVDFSHHGNMNKEKQIKVKQEKTLLLKGLIKVSSSHGSQSRLAQDNHIISCDDNLTHILKEPWTIVHTGPDTFDVPSDPSRSSSVLPLKNTKKIP
eukprot:10494878-Ditylum_brightwellii.AAC.1